MLRRSEQAQTRYEQVVYQFERGAKHIQKSGMSETLNSTLTLLAIDLIIIMSIMIIQGVSNARYSKKDKLFSGYRA